MNNFRWNIGDEVIVLNEAREYLSCGHVVGRYAGGEKLYDIQPLRTLHLNQRMHCIPQERLRGVAKPILAYERKTGPMPRHVMDEA